MYELLDLIQAWQLLGRLLFRMIEPTTHMRVTKRPQGYVSHLAGVQTWASQPDRVGGIPLADIAEHAVTR